MENKSILVKPEVFESMKQWRGQSLADKSRDKAFEASKAFYKEIGFEKDFTIVNEDTNEALEFSVEGNDAKFLTEKMVVESTQKLDEEIAKWKNEAWLIAKAEEEVAKLEQKKSLLKVGGVERAPSVVNVLIK
jgi:hypothetical protein